MWTKKKVAAYTGTRNLYPMMVPAVKSLLCYSDVGEVYLYIEDDKPPKIFDGMPREIVKFRNASDQTYFKKDGPNMKSQYSYMALMRAAYTKEFPELERILSLDVDTIITGDIPELWDLPLDANEGYYFSASKEPYATKEKGYLYTNIGVCLYNLDKLRDGKADEVIEALNTKKYKQVEQDVFNELCQDHILQMDPVYNSTPFTKVINSPKIVHYAGEKTWDDKNLVKQWSKESWDVILKYRERKWSHDRNRVSGNWKIIDL